jgi:ubiquinone biosynthesis protein COQ9
MMTKGNNDNNNFRDILIDKALRHVVFDGWSDSMFSKVCLELNLSKAQAQVFFPRGGVDMALAFHERDDEIFQKAFSTVESNNSNNRVRDRIESAINFRLEVADKNKEAVRRGISVLTTPLYISEGSRALWKTSDNIWNSIGDKGYNLNWYSKRLILSSVYSTVLIFWLEDDSENFVETRAFVQRRISDVMTVERVKGTIKRSPILGHIVEHFESLAGGLLERKENFPGWQSK